MSSQTMPYVPAPVPPALSPVEVRVCEEAGVEAIFRNPTEPFFWRKDTMELTWPSGLPHVGHGNR